MTISRKTFHNIFLFDLTLSFELSLILKNIGKKLGVCENKEILIKILKFVMEICFLYNKEECFFEDKAIVVYC